MKVQKFFCTLTIMGVIGLAVYWACVTTIHMPLWISDHGAPYDAPLILICLWAFVATFIIWLWYLGSSAICTALRRRFVRDLPQHEATQEFTE